MNKKATASDILMIAVLMFTFGIGFFVMNHVASQTFTQIQANPIINSTGNATAAFESMVTIANRMDYVIFGLFIGLILGVIVSGWFIAGNPIFTFLYFIVMTIAVILSAVFSNVWEEVVRNNTDIFGTTITNFPLTDNILSLLPIYITVIGVIGLVVIFGKPMFSAE